ncbi:MAG TPA: hypothetical protein VF656_10745 [Pyrinomonadaceae bacterium]|jgi:Tfp pilus assembly protein PilF
MSNASPAAPGAQAGELLRIYCTNHSLGFQASRASRLECPRGLHELDLNFPYDQPWDYCCDCQTFIPSNFSKGVKASHECVVCDRQIARRFLCASCQVLSYEADKPARGKLFTLEAKGSPQPSCPGCGQPPPHRLRGHACEVAGAFFNTARETCPFCLEAIPQPISFPISMADFMRDFKGEKIVARHHAPEWLLTAADDGEFLVITRGLGTTQTVALPKATSFDAPEDFDNSYKDYYDCEHPRAGDVFIISPAVIKEAEGGWKIAEVGRLEVRSGAAKDPLATKPLAPVGTSAPPAAVCPVCGTAGKPSHKFCKGCGARLPGAQFAAAAPPTPAAAPAAPAVHAASSAPTFNGHEPARAVVPLAEADATAIHSAPLTPAPGKPAEKGKGKLIGVVAAFTLVAVIVLGGLSMRGVGTFAFTTESKLDHAIAKGNLLSPSGESAYDYYAKLKQDGASASTLSKYNEKLLPLLTAQPERIMNDLINNFEGVGHPLPEWQEAQRLTAWASELKPDDQKLAAKAAYCKGRVAYLQDRFDDALDAWTQASRADPSWPLPLNGVGLIYNIKKDYSTARTYLLEAIQLAPNWAVPYNNMGTSYFLEKRYAQAEGYYQQAKERAPQWARPYAWLGDILAQRGDNCGASQMYQEALNRGTDGMSNWNPERIQRKVNDTAAKCNSISRAASRIVFGAGSTTARLTGATASGESYVIKVLAGQTMSVNLNSAENNATLRVFDARMESLASDRGSGSWTGSMPYTGDYYIVVEVADGMSHYTLDISIPPPGQNA